MMGGNLCVFIYNEVRGVGTPSIWGNIGAPHYHHPRAPISFGRPAPALITPTVRTNMYI